MLGATTNIQRTQVLNVEWGTEPSERPQRVEWFLLCGFFAGHCARRPAVKQQQLMGKSALRISLLLIICGHMVADADVKVCDKAQRFDSIANGSPLKEARREAP
jgi:hypothetical protein